MGKLERDMRNLKTEMAKLKNKKTKIPDVVAKLADLDGNMQYVERWQSVTFSRSGNEGSNLAAADVLSR